MPNILYVYDKMFGLWLAIQLIKKYPLIDPVHNSVQKYFVKLSDLDQKLLLRVLILVLSLISILDYLPIILSEQWSKIA